MDQRVSLMRTIVLLTQKGGTGKTTLAASLAVAAAQSGERVIALDLDPQASLVRWGERRAAAHARRTGSWSNRLTRTPAAAARHSRRPRRCGLHARHLRHGRCRRPGRAADHRSGRPLPLAVTADPSSTSKPRHRRSARFSSPSAKPPSCSTSVRSPTAARALARRPKASPNSACSPNRCWRPAWTIRTRSPRGLGVTEYDPGGRAAAEIKTLWNWSRAQFDSPETEAKTKSNSGRPEAARKPPGRRLRASKRPSI